jgi:hypothetical protein
MRTPFHIVLLAILAVLPVAPSGCGKKEAAAPNPAAEPVAATEAPAAGTPSAPRPQTTAPPAPANPADEVLVGSVHEFMTSQLRIFIQERGRMPNSFAEFAQARMDSVQRPPPGMKWAIDSTTQQVKLVKAN